HLRRVLDDAENYEHAVEMLSYQRLAAPCIFAVVGTENDQRLIIERTKRDFAHRKAEYDKPLFTTNHFHILPKPVCDNPGSLFKTSFRRWEGLCQRLPERNAWESVEDDWLLNVLTDEQIIQDITAQHILMRPRENTMGLWVPRHLVEETQPVV